METFSDASYSAMFYGKGKGKGKRRSFKKGHGKGRRTNPRGRDGQIMTCSICGSESHFRAECPQNTERSHFQYMSAPSRQGSAPTYVVGPLTDLLETSREPNSVEPTLALPTWDTTPQPTGQPISYGPDQEDASEEHEAGQQARGSLRSSGYGNSGWDRAARPGAWNADPLMTDEPMIQEEHDPEAERLRAERLASSGWDRAARPGTWATNPSAQSPAAGMPALQTPVDPQFVSHAAWRPPHTATDRPRSAVATEGAVD